MQNVLGQAVIVSLCHRLRRMLAGKVPEPPFLHLTVGRCHRAIGLGFFGASNFTILRTAAASFLSVALPARFSKSSAYCAKFIPHGGFDRHSEPRDLD